jgi:hypothetical protein
MPRDAAEERITEIHVFGAGRMAFYVGQDECR